MSDKSCLTCKYWRGNKNDNYKYMPTIVRFACDSEDARSNLKDNLNTPYYYGCTHWDDDDE